MHEFLHIFIDSLRNTVLITGMVVTMMMMIEALNIESHGLFFKGLRKTRLGQIVVASLLGSIPGCMGGFAAVSLYTHKMLSFGALVAMLIATSGDESFVMLAMFPDKALMIFAITFVVAILAGYVTDLVHDKIHSRHCHLQNHEHCGNTGRCEDGYELHREEAEEQAPEHTKAKRHFTWKRIILFVGLALFITALATGRLEHGHEAHAGHSINLLDEAWMNILFAAMSVVMLFVILLGSDHFIDEHLWHHIIKKHLPGIFSWTFGVLLVVGIALHFWDISSWISSNTVLMILLAALIGFIPESGPHMIFVTLFAAGIVPMPVLLASCISQDGHASIPLLAESKKSFLYAKIINFAVAVAIAMLVYWFV
ncbi:MAG: putative manganese transporter [Candidatus Cryptobacteroides sp.]